LTSLNLSSNSLKKLPAEIGQLINLTSLNLRDNKLTELPAEIGQITSLTSLDLRDNLNLDWAETFNQLSSLPNLTELNLSDNELTGLPVKIGQMTSLTSLDLRDNNLTSLPAEILKLTALTYFHLSANDFRISRQKCENLLNFIKSLDQQIIPYEIKELRLASYLEDLKQAKFIADQLTVEQLLRFLDDEDNNIRALMPHILGQRFNPFAESVDLSECIFHFLGRFTSVSSEEIKSWLRQKGAQVVSRLSKQVTHFAVGQGQGKIALKHLDSEVKLVFAPHLQQLMEKLDQPLLMQKTEGQSKLIDNLRQLLTSSDISNVKVGLIQMVGNGIPNELMTAVVSFYLYYQQKEVRQIASQAFRKHAPTELKMQIRSIWTANMRSIRNMAGRRKSMDKICQDNQLSAAQMFVWVECLKEFNATGNLNSFSGLESLKDKWHDFSSQLKFVIPDAKIEL